MEIGSFLTVRRLEADPGEALRRLEGTDTGALYRATMAAQNSLYIGALFPYLDGRPEWQRASSVLDLGCGPGDLVVQLCRRYPGRSFAGVDLSDEFIAAATAQARGLDACRFIHADLYDFAEGRWDFIVLRAVLQHLKEPDRLTRRLAVLLADGGAVFFQDTTRESFVESDPPIPAFDAFYERFAVVQKERSGGRDCIAEMEASLPGDGFRCLDSRVVAVEVDRAEDRERVVQYLLLVCTVASRLTGLEVDGLALAADLARWHGAGYSSLILKTRYLMAGRS